MALPTPIVLIAWLLRTAADSSADSCKAAGIGRAAFREREALQWLEEENAKRAPYYFTAARRMFEKALRQQNGIDKSNSDPFIALHEMQHQILGALDLSPNNASTWLHAGQATVMLASLDEDSKTKMSEALQFFAHACKLDAGQLDEMLQWSAQKDELFKGITKLKKVVHKQATKWKKSSVPVSRVERILPVLAARQSAEVCSQGAPMEPVSASSSSGPSGGQDSIRSALASMVVRPIFPTLITTVNVNKHFGKAWTDKLAKIAVKKYSTFSKERRRQGATDANDINDNFFSAQFTGEGQTQMPQAQAFWPELYNSKEYGELQAFMKSALIEHATKTGYDLSPADRSKTHTVLWAAVYLSEGTRHGYHVHQGSLSSCVFYAASPSGKTPIMFIDPRGAPPINDYEQHLGERDFEPVSPFHHNYNFFAEAGDLVCFPSWLVHRVPSHFEKDPRVAFPANLQADNLWDAWYRSATLP